MDITKTLLEFSQGLLSYEEFEAFLSLNPNAWEMIQALVPDNISNESCLFRKIYPNMKGFETNNFNVRATLSAFGFQPRSVWSMISALVKFRYPDIVTAYPPDESLESILERLGLDFIGGNEADTLVRELFARNPSIGTKEKKQLLKDYFHISPRKYPRWIQDPQWPVLRGIPMRFVSQEKKGQVYTYHFEDTETGETKTITQML